MRAYPDIVYAIKRGGLDRLAKRIRGCLAGVILQQAEAKISIDAFGRRHEKEGLSLQQVRQQTECERKLERGRGQKRRL